MRPHSSHLLIGTSVHRSYEKTSREDQGPGSWPLPGRSGLSCQVPAHRLCARLGWRGRCCQVRKRAGHRRESDHLPVGPAPSTHARALSLDRTAPVSSAVAEKGPSCLPVGTALCFTPRPPAGHCVISGKIPTSLDFKFSNFFKGRI